MESRRSLRSGLGCSALAMALLSSSVLSAEPIPQNRRTDLDLHRRPGGIPNRTTICATFNPGATAAAINSAIVACNNGVVKLNAGDVQLSGHQAP